MFTQKQKLNRCLHDKKCLLYMISISDFALMVLGKA